MNFSKSKVLLKKINAIHESGESFDGQLSTLEKDLILQYIRQLYECISERGEEYSVNESPKTRNQRQVKESTIPAAASSISISKQPKPVESIMSPNGQVANEATVDIATPDVIKEVQVQEPVSIEADPELEALFDASKIQDLSQRFANAPITDVAKAMGINERILTINELFKGDQQAFQEVANHLNGLASFDEAKKYLITGIANSNEWTKNKRKKKAEIFIKLVRRRYL